MVSAGDTKFSAAMPYDGKTVAIAKLIRQRTDSNIRRLLVVGCGSGIEAAILARELNTEVVGIDLSSTFDPSAASLATLRQGDATSLEFGDETFDFVYSYHALEHIPNYRKALAEMYRVLIPNGGYCIGTPNRLRLVGYIGSKDATLSQKIHWNFVDIKARLRGKFRNECGAHAGYSSSELRRALEEFFDGAEEITRDYYLAIYSSYTGLVRFLDKSGLGKIFFPAIYFMGKKTGS